MTPNRPSVSARFAAFLDGLSRDTAGNTLAIIAAALIPLLAMVGGGVDVSRGYLAESRLQQACDAGVLAARKRMGSNLVAGVMSADSLKAGQAFFDVNFRDGMYGTRDRRFSMKVESDFTVAGTASVVVPTTIMNIFGYTEMPLRASCGAQLNMSNTDIMMVLDVTGSMGTTNMGDSKSRIESLKDVVRSFYAQLASANKAGSRIRYGFVPYSTNVNVGDLLEPDWIADKWTYNTREPISSGGTKRWNYDSILTDVRFAKKGKTKKFKIGGTSLKPSKVAVGWDGCVEERKTYQITDYANVDLSKAMDLDLDLVPDPGKPDTQWKPMLRDLSFVRGIGAAPNRFSIPALETTSDYVNAAWWGYSACPPKAMKLAPLTAAQLDIFLATLKPQGNTYHDIGMIWGGRLISPTGLFAAENADVNGVSTSRNLIFLTDGETAPLDISYTSYGIEPLDLRRWGPGSPLSLTKTVEKRFGFACEEVKKRNITVWVVGFGTTLSPTMTDCAGPGHYFEAANAIALQQTFDDIAKRIGDLRIAK